MSGVGLLPGVSVDFEQGHISACSVCNAPVDLDSMIIVNIVQPDGSEAKSEMTEANARVLLMQVGLTPPPVECGRHATIILENAPRSLDD